MSWIYAHMVDLLHRDTFALSGKWSRMYELVKLHMLDPYVITDENWGMSQTAEQGQRAMEARFGMALPNPQRERSESPDDH